MKEDAMLPPADLMEAANVAGFDVSHSGAAWPQFTVWRRDMTSMLRCEPYGGAYRFLVWNTWPWHVGSAADVIRQAETCCNG